MAEEKPRIAVLEEETTDKEHFTNRLAAFCNIYVMEIAKPIMEHRDELYENKAIVRLVDLWFEADRQYEHKRQTYLVQWADMKDDGWEPLESYTWADKKRQGYRDALYALLVA